MNHKRVYRLYREEGLAIRTKLPRRKRAWRYRAGRPEIVAPNEVWAMDFMSDALFDGRAFRLLTIVTAARERVLRQSREPTSAPSTSCRN